MDLNNNVADHPTATCC